MDFLLRFIIGILVICAGLILLIRSYKIVQKIGYNDWAEEHLGGGGTYTLVKLIGITLIFISILLILGIIPLPI